MSGQESSQAKQADTMELEFFVEQGGPRAVAPERNGALLESFQITPAGKRHRQVGGSDILSPLK